MAPPNIADSNQAAIGFIRDLIHQKTGIYYEDERMYLLAEKLWPLVERKGLTTIIDYYFLLKFDQNAEEEWQRIESEIATSETYFWREFDQIRAAVQVIIPELQRKSPKVPVRIWHAGCATGEEAYTMAMALMEAGRYLFGPIEILATDMDRKALEHARKGIYRKRSFRAIPPEIEHKYFIETSNQHFELVDSVKNRVQFEYLNLLNEQSMSAMRGFDIIFCRNVFIYFSDAAIRKVTDSFSKALRKPGYLFTASTESLIKLTDEFELTEVNEAFGYLKCPISEK